MPLQKPPRVRLPAGKARIDGLPEGAVITDRTLRLALSRGAFRLEATPGRRDGFYDVTLNPARVTGERYRPRRRKDSSAYYDPSLARLETEDAGDFLERTWVRPNDGLSERIEALTEPGIIYRGMSCEEYESFVESGEIRSLGDYNMEGQEGMTCWATDPDTARSYANSFAPMAYKPTFERPAYVVAARMPDDFVRTKGMGMNEVGLMEPVRADEVVAVWEGSVYDFDPGSIEVRDNGSGFETGSWNAPRADVVWRKMDPDRIPSRDGGNPVPGR